jgi:tetratricopeptide (TPR) repeat protein
MAFTGKLRARNPQGPTAKVFPRGRNLRNRHLLILLVAVAGVFGAAISFDFVWDDRLLLVGLDVYESFDLGGMFFSLANQLEYLPVRDVSYAVDYALWGEDPSGFHLTNLVLYFLNVAVVYLMTLQLTPLLFSAGRAMPETKAAEVALFTALLFAVHPIHSEAVSFISCRNVLLSGLFFFMSCSFFLKHLGASGRWFYAASLLCCGLAIFSKATAVVLPGVLLLIAAFDAGSWRKKILLLAPFAAVSVAAVILFRAVATDTGLIDLDQVVAFGSRSFAARLAVAVQIPFFYLGKLVVPSDLSALYTVRFGTDLGDPRVLLSMLALAAAAACGIWLRKRFPELLFALGWYLVALFPVLNFFATATVVADRYVYLPSYAFAYLVVTALALSHPKIPAIAIRSAAAAAVAVLSFLAFERSGVWRSEETLWTDTIRVSPEGQTAYYNLAVHYFSRGEYEKTFRLFEPLVAERPWSDGALRLFKAQHAFNQGDFLGAIELLEGTPYGEEIPYQIRSLLARAYEAAGNIHKAIEHYAAVLQQGGNHAGDEAVAAAAERLPMLQAKISPQFEGQRSRVREQPSDLNARAELAVALENAGLYDEALGHYGELSRRGGDSWILFYNMGNAYKKLGRYEEAAASYEKSLSLNPDHPDSYNNLGVVLKKLHEDERAIRAFEAVMQLDPGFQKAPFNLATLYFRLGDRENAMRLFDLVERSFPELRSEVDPYLHALK